MKKAVYIMSITSIVCLLSGCTVGNIQKLEPTTETNVETEENIEQTQSETLDSLNGNVTTEETQESLENVSSEEQKDTTSVLSVEQNELLEVIGNINSFEGVLNTEIATKVPMTQEQKEEWERIGNDASYAYYNLSLDTNVNIITTREITNIYGYTVGDSTKNTLIPVNIYKDSVNDIEYVDEYTKSTGSHIWVTNKDYSNTVIEDLEMLVENTQEIKTIPQDGKTSYKGKISTETLKKLDYLSLADTTYIDVTSGEDINIPITYLVKDKGSQLISVKFDLTEMVKSVNSSITIKKSESLLTLNKIGNTVVGIPEDVKNTTGVAQSLVSDNMSIYKEYYEGTYGKEVTNEILVQIIRSKLGTKYDILLNYDEDTEDNENDLDNIVLDKLRTFIEHNTVEELRDYIKYYKYCSKDEQVAYCMMAQLGIEGFDESYIQSQGILNSSIEEMINEYIQETIENVEE